MTDTTGAKTFRDLAPREQLAMGAFKLAMRQLGVPAHPDGKCPAAECNCSPMADAIEKRAVELVTDPGIDDADVCADCYVLIPFPFGHCYGVDSDLVCEPCGLARYGDKADEYLIVGAEREEI
jgi:hypothetical protein